MKTTVQAHIENIGSGHQSATNYDDLGRQEIKFQTLYEDNQVAKLRGQFALNKHYDQKKQKGNITYYRISSNYSPLFPEKCTTLKYFQYCNFFLLSFWILGLSRLIVI